MNAGAMVVSDSFTDHQMYCKLILGNCEWQINLLSAETVLERQSSDITNIR